MIMGYEAFQQLKLGVALLLSNNSWEAWQHFISTAGKF